MSKVRMSALAIAAATLSAGAASAADQTKIIDGKKGIGYSQAIGGPAGLAFNYGTGNLAIEAILGVDMKMPKDGDGANTIGVGVGVHYFALTAGDKAAFSVGGRFNFGLGSIPDAADPTKREGINQIGIDVPVRVYWFPVENISVHAEMGVRVAIIGDKGPVDGFPSGAGPESKQITIGGIPGGGNGFGNIGLTFWW